MMAYVFPTVPDVKRLYGLIGYPLSHSFSKGYFADKFNREQIVGAYYEAFAIEEVTLMPALFGQYPNLVGLNVTIPYKEQVIPHLVSLEAGASQIHAVNTIKKTEAGLIGYNTDITGFQQSLLEMFERSRTKVGGTKALILGTGGAAKAIRYVLEVLAIPFLMVSRRAGAQTITYAEVTREVMMSHQLIINTTPLGMSPHIDSAPAIPYEFVNAEHLLFDLVYNPGVTLFLKKGLEQGATIQNGLDMLHYQAEASWKIWNE